MHCLIRNLPLDCHKGEDTDELELGVCGAMDTVAECLFFCPSGVVPSTKEKYPGLAV